jgi:hypothetical protein
VNFKFKLLKRNKEGYFILIKGAIPQDEITIINLYAPNVSAPNFIKHTPKDLKPHLDSNTVVVGDFNTPLLIQTKYQQGILELNDTIDLMELTDVYRLFQPAATQYTFFSAAHGISAKYIIS